MRCRKGGSLYQSASCVEDPELMRSLLGSLSRKKVCDDRFYTAMRAANKNKAVCNALAIVYRDAVKAWGGEAFTGLDAVARPAAWSQAQADYNAALQAFFLSGTTAQFQDFVRRSDSHRAPVRLDAPLRYDAAKGLINIAAEAK